MDRPPRSTYAFRTTSRDPDAEAGPAAKQTSLRTWIVAGIVVPPVIFVVIDLVRVSLGYSPLIFAIIDLARTSLGHPIPTAFRPVFLALIGVGVSYGFGFVLTWKKVFASSFDFVLATAYLIAWYAPALVGEGRLEYFVWLIPVEFIATSCAFGVTLLLDIETSRNKLKVVAVLLFLVASSIAISYRVGHWWPFVGVAVLGANQAMSLVWNWNSDGSTDHAYPPWLFRWFLFVLLPGILLVWAMPQLGWKELSFPLLERQLHVFLVGAIPPFAVIVFGFFYFLWSGLYELTGIREMKNRTRRDPA